MQLGFLFTNVTADMAAFVALLQGLEPFLSSIGLCSLRCRFRGHMLRHWGRAALWRACEIAMCWGSRAVNVLGEMVVDVKIQA